VKRYNNPSIRVIKEPEEIAQDKSEAWEIVEYTVEYLDLQMENPIIVYLQPTSPLRHSGDVLHCMDIYEGMKVPVTTAYRESKDHDPWRYNLNGAVYVTSFNEIMEAKSLWKHAELLYIMPKDRSVNIDTMEDFLLAGDIIAKKRNAIILQKQKEKNKKKRNSEPNFEPDTSL
jgi:CMP-N-acetylneuraminic acid synthetase